MMPFTLLAPPSRTAPATPISTFETFLKIQKIFFITSFMTVISN